VTRFGVPNNREELAQHRLLTNTTSPTLNRWASTGCRMCVHASTIGRTGYPELHERRLQRRDAPLVWMLEDTSTIEPPRVIRGRAFRTVKNTPRAFDNNSNRGATAVKAAPASG
jgi:hypothetical protein